jgi:hypothetical protein
MRAFTSAIFVLVVSLVGTGFGPTVTGLLSDLFATRFGLGEAALRYALPTCLIPALAGCAFFWRAASHLPKEMRSLHEIAPAGVNEVEPLAAAPVAGAS